MKCAITACGIVHDPLGLCDNCEGFCCEKCFDQSLCCKQVGVKPCSKEELAPKKRRMDDAPPK
jgi:hypothetical protein